MQRRLRGRLVMKHDQEWLEKNASYDSACHGHQIQTAKRYLEHMASQLQARVDELEQTRDMLQHRIEVMTGDKPVTTWTSAWGSDTRLKEHDTIEMPNISGQQSQAYKRGFDDAKARFKELEALFKLIPANQWHEDMGDVLWFHVPIQEPPYVGSPRDCNWSDVWPSGETAETWYTHFIPLPPESLLIAQEASD